MGLDMLCFESQGEHALDIGSQPLHLMMHGWKLLIGTLIETTLLK